MESRDDHAPVLVAEVVRLLAPERGGLLVDATVGLGGHALALLEAAPAVSLVGIDRDADALEEAGRRLDRFGERARLVRGEFGELAAILAGLGISRVAGVLADLGLSSRQLARAERGFSFRQEGPLDMRMGDEGRTAEEVINTYPEGTLEKIFREYGEEREARRIARAVGAARRRQPLTTTRELAELVRRVKRGRPEKIDPATRVFQALRIEVNQELVQLRRLIDQAVRLLEPEGRLVVISYHSLEDRIVKHRFREMERGIPDPVTGRPRAETQLIQTLTRRPVRPSAQEVRANPRARSARLRAARRTGG